MAQSFKEISHLRTNKKKYNSNYDKIFGKNKNKKEKKDKKVTKDNKDIADNKKGNEDE